ncbi:MAG: NADH-quinone oxidoreductase subunit NuoH [Chloroflexi bacterium]|nr:NADH-quinone oxidoreductase subunit NuoH [Chloroflexota bacterium]
MDFLNNLFTNLYDAIKIFLVDFLKGTTLRADAQSALVALVMAIIAITAILIFAPLTMLALTYLERKLVGRIQNRIGANRAGPFGLLQPVADMIKFFIKEDIVPANADKLVHTLAPIVVNIPVVLAFAVLPFGKGMTAVDINVGLLYVVAVGSVGTIVIFMAGFGSSNKFALIGGMRAVAQIISYEVPQVFSLVTVLLLTGTMSLTKIVDAQSGWGGFQWFVFAFPVGPIAFFIFFLAAMAEANRTPFDLPEGESEIVSGHHTEYSGMKFGMFYFAEFLNLFFLCALGATLFLGGWQGPILPPWLWLLIKTYALIWIAFWWRGTLPRFRIDQLMGFAWKVLVPLALVNIFLTTVLLPIYDSLGF